MVTSAKTGDGLEDWFEFLKEQKEKSTDYTDKK
jgi:hypothetical protein